MTVGKGRRNRDMRQELRPFEALYAKADKQQRTAGGFAVAALILTVLGLFLPLWSIAVMQQNLDASLYDATELAVLTPWLPLGRLALGLIAVGVLASAIFVWCRRPGWSAAALALCAGGEGLLTYFAVVLGQVFAYDQLEQRGLAFGDLLVRYYVLLLPFCLLVAALCCAFAARKKRMVASVMETAADTAPTVMLDDEETV